MAKDPSFNSAKYYQNSVYIKDFFKSINHIRNKRKTDIILNKSNLHQSTIRMANNTHNAVDCLLNDEYTDIHYDTKEEDGLEEGSELSLTGVIKHGTPEEEKVNNNKDGNYN